MHFSEHYTHQQHVHIMEMRFDSNEVNKYSAVRGVNEPRQVEFQGAQARLICKLNMSF